MVSRPTGRWDPMSRVCLYIRTSVCGWRFFLETVHYFFLKLYGKLGLVSVKKFSKHFFDNFHHFNQKLSKIGHLAGLFAGIAGNPRKTWKYVFLKPKYTIYEDQDLIIFTMCIFSISVCKNRTKTIFNTFHTKCSNVRRNLLRKYWKVILKIADFI